MNLRGPGELSILTANGTGVYTGWEATTLICGQWVLQVRTVKKIIQAIQGYFACQGTMSEEFEAKG